MQNSNGTRIAVVAGMRTPFVKAGTAFKHVTPLQLATHAVDGLIGTQRVDPSTVDELVYGIVLHDPRIPNLAREISFKSTLPSSVRAHTVSNNCITGIHAITAVYDSIVDGRAEIGVAGGVESMSNPAILFDHRASRLFLDVAGARGWRGKLGLALKLRPRHFKPNFPAIAEPSTGLSMGEHTELTVKEWGISRKEQDEIA